MRHAKHQKKPCSFVISSYEPAHWKVNLVWSMSAAVMMERETVEARLMALRQSELDRFQAAAEAAELAAKIAREKAEAIDSARAVGWVKDLFSVVMMIEESGTGARRQILVHRHYVPLSLCFQQAQTLESRENDKAII